jgi:uncharacterized protein involved in outer membrane biogenesis
MKTKARPYMRRLLKILILILCIIIILLIAGYFLLTSFLTGAHIQNLAQKMATQTLERPVEIGRVGLRIGFGIGITIDDLSVRNIEGFRPGPMLEIKRTILNVQLLPLLTRRVVIKRIEVQKLQANVEQNSRKELNFAGLMPKEAKGVGWVVSLSKITIRDSKVHYWDVLTKTEYMVEDIDQHIDFRRNRISVRGRLTARIPELENIPQLELSISNMVHYDTLSKDLEVTELSVATKPLRMHVSGSVEKDSILDLQGSINIKELSRLTSLIPSSAQPEAMDGAIKGDFLVNGTIKKPAISGQFELSDIKIVPKGMERGFEKINGKLSFDHESIEDISIQGNIGATRFNLKGTVSDILTEKPALKISADIEGDLKDFQGLTEETKTITMKGALSSSVQVRGTADKPLFTGDIKIANAMIDGIGLGRPISNMNFNGRLAQDALRITGCKGEIGRSDFSFTGQISDFKKPVIRIDNRSKYIDLDEIMPKTKQGKTTQGKPAPLTLNGSLHIDRLTGMDMEFKNISASFKYENGVIDLRDGRAQSFDGEVFIDFHYDFKKPEPYQLSTRMQSVSSEKILQRFLRFNRLQGKLTGTGKFQGRGFDQKSAVSNLDAAGNLKFSEGKFSNYILLTQMLDWLGMKNYQNVEFNNMQCSFTIAKGQATIEDLTMSSRTGDYLVNGTIGLDGRVDLAIAATLSKSSSDIVKRYHGDWVFFVDNQGRAVIDFIIKGKHDSPTFTLDSNKMKQRLSGKVKNEFEKKKQELEQKIKNWLKW